MNTMAKVTIKQEKLDQEYLESELQLNQPQHDIKEQVSCKEEDSSQNRYESYNIKEEFEESEEDFCGQKEAPRHNFEKYNVSCKEEQQVEGKEEYTIYYMKEEVEEEHASNHDSDSSCGSNMTPKRALNQTIEAQSLFNSELSDDSSLAPRVAGKEGNIEVEKEFKTKEPTAERSHDERRKSYTGACCGPNMTPKSALHQTIEAQSLFNSELSEDSSPLAGRVVRKEDSIQVEKELKTKEPTADQSHYARRNSYTGACCGPNMTPKSVLHETIEAQSMFNSELSEDSSPLAGRVVRKEDNIQVEKELKTKEPTADQSHYARRNSYTGIQHDELSNDSNRFDTNDHTCISLGGIHEQTKGDIASTSDKSISKEKNLHCSECKKGFTHNCQLVQHMRTHTGEKPYQCTECDKAYATKDSLKKHMRTHTGERPYHCLECNNRFAQKSHLKSHMVTHTGEMPYHCTDCNQRFALKNTLKNHIRIHTGEKPYQCTECNKLFARKSTLKIHIRNHTGEKPYQCTECNKLFAWKSTLMKHIRTHTGEKPYQ